MDSKRASQLGSLKALVRQQFAAKPETPEQQQQQQQMLARKVKLKLRNLYQPASQTSNMRKHVSN